MYPFNPKNWFNVELEEHLKVLLKYLPEGRIYRQAYAVGSVFNTTLKWIAKSFVNLSNALNVTFRGLFICKSNRFLAEHMLDYGLPNAVFTRSDAHTHVRDVYCLKYLMFDNTPDNFRYIGNLYGLKVKVVDHVGLPNLIGIYVQHYTISADFPTEARYNAVVDRVMRIYAIIKPIHCEISLHRVSTVYPEIVEFKCNAFNLDIETALPYILRADGDINIGSGVYGELTFTGEN